MTIFLDDRYNKWAGELLNGCRWKIRLGAYTKDRGDSTHLLFREIDDGNLLRSDEHYMEYLDEYVHEPFRRARNKLSQLKKSLKSNSLWEMVYFLLVS